MCLRLAILGLVASVSTTAGAQSSNTSSNSSSNNGVVRERVVDTYCDSSAAEALSATSIEMDLTTALPMMCAAMAHVAAEMNDALLVGRFAISITTVMDVLVGGSTTTP